METQQVDQATLSICQPASSPEQGKEGKEDLIASPPGLWRPSSVVRKDRKSAIIIWVCLLAVFVAYVINVVREAYDARSHPLTSKNIKEEVFAFPDVALCVSRNRGCNTDPALCAENMVFELLNQRGFDVDFSLSLRDNASLAIEEAFPNCKVLPTSKMEVNRTGIDNGDIQSLTVSSMALWFENGIEPPTRSGDWFLFRQIVDLFFLDVDAGPQAFQKEAPDGVLAYERILAADPIHTLTSTHMVMTLTEFTGISKDGKQRETKKTYTQRITTGPLLFAAPLSGMGTYAAVAFTMTIDKFEFGSITEVDPVDPWEIIGTVGGLWQYVVLAFGVFFVYSEEQLPEFKMRNFRKICKPETVEQPCSGVGSVDLTQVDEDETARDILPVGWVKRRTTDGKIYYLDYVQKITQWERPASQMTASPTLHQNSTDSRCAGGNAGMSCTSIDPTASCSLVSAEHYSTADRVSCASMDPASKGKDVAEPTHLPPTWSKRYTKDGTPYYANSISKQTQWQAPGR